MPCGKSPIRHCSPLPGAYVALPQIPPARVMRFDLDQCSIHSHARVPGTCTQGLKYAAMDTIRDSGSAIEEIFTPVGRTILGAGPLERRDPMNADPEVVGPVFYGDRPARRTADISIVIPVFNEVDALRALHRLLCAALERIAQSVEIVFCDDGSDDGSADLLDEIAASDLRISVVHLRRNYGQTAAIMAGIRRSAGAIIIAMDADGQNDPADIGRLIAKLDEGFDVVSGWRTDRRGPGAVPPTALHDLPTG